MLEWMGKKKVVNHHNDVPYHVLERKWSFDGRARTPAAPPAGHDGEGAVATQGGGFGYYELGPQLMINGVLNEDVPTEKIREYVYYAETRGTNRTIEQSEQSNNPNNRTIPKIPIFWALPMAWRITSATKRRSR